MVKHLLGIIDDILDLSKIESGKLMVESIAYSPIKIVEEVLTLMAVRSAAKGIALDSVFETGVPAMIQTDPTLSSPNHFEFSRQRHQVHRKGKCSYCCQIRY